MSEAKNEIVFISDSSGHNDFLFIEPGDELFIGGEKVGRVTEVHTEINVNGKSSVRIGFDAPWTAARALLSERT